MKNLNKLSFLDRSTEYNKFGFHWAAQIMNNLVQMKGLSMDEYLEAADKIKDDTFFGCHYIDKDMNIQDSGHVITATLQNHYVKAMENNVKDLFEDFNWAEFALDINRQTSFGMFADGQHINTSPINCAAISCVNKFAKIVADKLGQKMTELDFED